MHSNFLRDFSISKLTQLMCGSDTIVPMRDIIVALSIHSPCHFYTLACFKCIPKIQNCKTKAMHLYSCLQFGTYNDSSYISRDCPLFSVICIRVTTFVVSYSIFVRLDAVSQR